MFKSNKFILVLIVLFNFMGIRILAKLSSNEQEFIKCLSTSKSMHKCLILLFFDRNDSMNPNDDFFSRVNDNAGDFVFLNYLLITILIINCIYR